MVFNLAIAPVSPGATHLQDHRHRPMRGEGVILPDGTARPQPFPRNRDAQQQPRREREQAGTPDTERNSSATFDAALIAGTLPPAPQAPDGLVRRASEGPPESAARLRDILA